MQNGLKVLRPIFLVSFLFFAQYAVATYINSSALERFVNAQYTSLYYVFGAMGGILLLWLLPKIVKSAGLLRTTITIYSLIAVALLILGTTNTPMVFTGVFVAYCALLNTVWYCNDLFVSHYSDAHTAGNTRGVYLTIINTAIALMPVIAGILVTTIGLSSVYIVGAALMIIAVATIAYSQRKFIDRPYNETTIAAAWNVVRQSPPLRRVLSINFLLQFFYVWMTIFTPLYMSLVLHFSWTQIGTSFSIMLIPFILLQYKIGKIADKLGEKWLLILGFFIAATSTALFALLELYTHSIAIYTAVLFMSRVGICMVEVLSETYFFKQVSDQDEGVVSLFRIMHPLSYVAAPLLGWVIVATTSYATLFLVLGAFLLIGTLYSFRLVDIR